MAKAYHFLVPAFLIVSLFLRVDLIQVIDI
jgi:hypothetical protein